MCKHKLNILNMFQTSSFPLLAVFILSIFFKTVTTLCHSMSITESLWSPLLNENLNLTCTITLICIDDFCVQFPLSFALTVCFPEASSTYYTFDTLPPQHSYFEESIYPMCLFSSFPPFLFSVSIHSPDLLGHLISATLERWPNQLSCLAITVSVTSMSTPVSLLVS